MAGAMTASERGASLVAALEGTRRPCAVVDLDAFDRNHARLVEPLRPGLTLRVASKSLRIPALVKRVLDHPRSMGVLCYHVREARLLADQGVDDLFVAYPPAPDDVDDFAELSQRCRVRATVDAPIQVEALGRAARQAGATVEVAIDLDLSLRLAGQHIGVRRSPVRSVADAVALARSIENTDGVELTGLLAYEAQIAGVQDHTGTPVDLAMKLVKSRSRALALERRQAVVEALREHVDLPVVNGGGTGSVHFTGADPSVTEVSAGSGLLCPHLFDGYAGLDLEPAAFFALSVVRRSDAGFATCFGGGYPASGAAGADRLPRVWWPEGVKGVGLEGFGEVQTPLRHPGLAWGDTVLCRHAKAGELAERFDAVHLVQGGQIVETVPTYRGCGLATG